MLDKTKMNNDSFVHGEMTQEENEVYQVYRRMQDAMIAKDINTLNIVIMDGTRMKHSDGSTQSKEEYFGEITSGVLNYYHTDLKDIQIKVTGDMAVLKCTVYLQAKVYGMSGTFPFSVDTSFEKKNGKWFYIDYPKSY